MTLAVASLEDYPAPSAMSERTLFRGYATSSVVRTEACACGGVIVQRLDEAPEELVARHVRGIQHAAWSAETREL